jgi:hypothetical protein
MSNGEMFKPDFSERDKKQTMKISEELYKLAF